MSTRGSVCWIEDNRGTVRGVYNHSDSYPTWLGEQVWSKARQVGIGNLIATLKLFSDWRDLETDGVCPYCGKVAGHPVSIRGDMYLAHMEGQQYPDPEAKYHKHTNGADDQFDPFTDPLSMQWVYLLDDEHNSIQVWKAVKATKNIGGVHTEPIEGYCHVLIATLGVDSCPDPDWESLERA